MTRPSATLRDAAYCGVVLARVDVGELAELPPFEVSRILTEWGIDPFLNVLTVWVAGAYLYGVWVLRSRGDSWPLARTFSFVVAGMGSFYFVTSSGIAAYDTALLSVHMVQHMALSMLVPLALALGAPVTLALRVLPRRPRGWLLAVLHSPPVKVLSFPPLAFGLFVLSPWLLLGVLPPALYELWLLQPLLPG